MKKHTNFSEMFNDDDYVSKEEREEINYHVKHMNDLLYPAIFKPFSDGSGGYVVEFPDLPGCITEGRSLEEALEMAEDTANGWIIGELKNGKEVPLPSKKEEISANNGEAVKMVCVASSFFADTMRGLLEAIEINKGIKKKDL